MDISKFESQHQDALVLLDQLESQCNAKELDSFTLSETLVNLAAKLKFHLAMEDKFLYPKAAQSTDDSLKNLSEMMKDEMMEISLVFDRFVNRWTRITIQRESSQFIKEAHQIILAIRTRIEKEESGLYPLAAKHL